MAAALGRIAAGQLDQALLDIPLDLDLVGARRLLDRIEWHYTPKHGSWVNMAETEISIMNGQCLDRRLDNQETIATEVAAWEGKRNAQEACIHWTFTLAVARQKLRKLYPSNED